MRQVIIFSLVLLSLFLISTTLVQAANDPPWCSPLQSGLCPASCPDSGPWHPDWPVFCYDSGPSSHICCEVEPLPTPTPTDTPTPTSTPIPPSPTPSGGCTSDTDCPGCQSCNASNGACYDDNRWCLPGQYCWRATCYVNPTPPPGVTPTPTPTGTLTPTPPGATSTPTATPTPGSCNFGNCGINGCPPNQRYVSGNCSYEWYTGPGCYLDDSCSGDPGPESSPPRVSVCLKVSKTDPPSETVECDEDKASNLESSAPLTLAPGETFYAYLYFNVLGEDLTLGAEAQIFFAEPGISNGLRSVIRYCWNPAQENVNSPRFWLPNLTSPSAGGGIISGRNCRYPADWVNGEPCMFANQNWPEGWNYETPLTCNDGSTNQYNEGWGNIGRSISNMGFVWEPAGGSDDSPQRLITSSITCYGTLCESGPWMSGNLNPYGVKIPLKIKSNVTTQTIKFRGAVHDNKYVNPTAYLGPVVNPTICSNFSTNWSERTYQNGWGWGGGPSGSPSTPTFGACHGWGQYEDFYFFSNYINIKVVAPSPTPTPTSTPSPTPLPTPGGLSSTCPQPGTFAYVSWLPVTGASYYKLRFDDMAPSWSGNCGSLNPGDACPGENPHNITPGNNCSGGVCRYTHPSTTPLHFYLWWLWGCSASNSCSESVHQSFTCYTTPAWMQVINGDVHSNQ